jgi:predicted permease
MTSAVMVSPGFFGTLGISLTRGRDFAETDDDRHPRAGIVSRSLAERLFPDGDAIGKSIRFGVMPEFQDIQIVGVASNARIFDLRDAAPPVIYVSCLQYPKWAQWGDLFVRVNGSPEVLARVIAHEIDSLGHEYALRTRTIEQTMSYILVKERVTALLSGFFAALALLLACVGLYGLMSYGVTRRTREIGVRVALGAQSGRVLSMVLGETLALALFGIAIGIPSALAATRLIASMLFGLSPNDLPTITGASLLLLLVALFAGYLPARRASAIDPMVALRTEIRRGGGGSRIQNTGRSTANDEATKTTERKRRFEEQRRRLEQAEQGSKVGSGTEVNADQTLFVSPSVTNMLVGDIRESCVFDKNSDA